MGVGQYVAKEIIKEIGNRSREFYEFVMPPLDIYEDGSELVVIIDLPGFDKKDIHINISKDILSIRAQRIDDSDASIVYFKQRPNRIEKKIPLPVSILEEDNINTKAEYKDGEITLRIPLLKTSNIQIL